MRAKVPALPTQSTSMRAAPSEARTSTATETRTSRTKVAAPNQTGTAPWRVMVTTAVATSTRSATGSKTFPTVEIWWKRRATYPSIQSVAPSAPRSTAAPVWRWAPNSSHT